MITQFTSARATPAQTSDRETGDAAVVAEASASSEASATSMASAAGLRVLASARWPEHAQDALDPIAGFIESSFNPLVAEVADRCLNRCHGAPPVADPVRATRTALLLASSNWDQGTASALARAVQEGRRVPTLLFFQSNPNAILGYVAARWGLGGPVMCVGAAPWDVAQEPDSDREVAAVLAEALAEAALVIEDGDADEALVIVAEQSGTTAPRDAAVALLVAQGDTTRPRQATQGTNMAARSTLEGRIR